MVQRLLFGVLLVGLGIGLIVWSFTRPSHVEPASLAGEDDEGVVCIQVRTDAKDPENGEVHTFSTPCDVPEGWEVVGPTM